MFVKNFYKLMARNYFFYSNTSVVKVPIADGGQSDIIQLCYNTFSNNATKYPYMGTIVKSYYGGGGVMFGDGTTPVTLDDYKLSGNIITTISSSVSLSWDSDDEGCSGTALYTLTNSGDSAITISEVGLFSGVFSNNNMNYMLERTVLDEPVTIEAGAIGQVTYTIRLNYPTA